MSAQFTSLRTIHTNTQFHFDWSLNTLVLQYNPVIVEFVLADYMKQITNVDFHLHLRNLKFTSFVKRTIFP